MIRKFILVAFILGVLVACNNTNDTVSKINFDKLKDSANYLVLDVRTAEEHLDYTIPCKQQNLDVNQANFETEIAKLDKQKTYLVYCKAGHRSAIAVTKMKKMGLKCYSLEGGVDDYLRAK